MHVATPAGSSLPQTLDKMEHEWEGLDFRVLPYKDSGAFILGGTDDIQTVLDDQIVKIQAMNASPFVKPFKERASAWESTLQNLQVRRCVALGTCGRACNSIWGCAKCVKLGGAQMRVRVFVYGDPSLNCWPPPGLPAAGHAGQLAQVPGHLAVPGAHLQQRRHRQADARGGRQVQVRLGTGRQAPRAVHAMRAPMTYGMHAAPNHSYLHAPTHSQAS